MAVEMTIREIPDSVAAELRRRAREHHRSPEDEALDVLKAAVTTRGHLTAAQVLAEVRALGVSTPSESAAMIREDRDAGHRD